MLQSYQYHSASDPPNLSKRLASQLASPQVCRQLTSFQALPSANLSKLNSPQVCAAQRQRQRGAKEAERFHRCKPAAAAVCQRSADSAAGGKVLQQLAHRGPSGEVHHGIGCD